MDNNLEKMSKENLLELIEAQEQKIQELNSKVDFYEEQIRLANRQKYGRKSEKTSKDQMSLMDQLFNEAEVLDDHEKEKEAADDQPSKKQGKNKKHLTKGVIEKVTPITHPLKSLACEKCGGPIKVIGAETVSTEIVYHPGHYEMIIHKQEVGVCPHCNQERNGKYDDSGFVKAPMPKKLLPKSALSGSLAAKIFNDKFQKSLPFYRQQKEFEARGIDISRQTMSNWAIALYDTYLWRIIEYMTKKQKESTLLLVDETPVETLNHPDKEPSKNNSYMWVSRTGPYEKIQIVIYQYELGRNYEFAQQILEGYDNLVQADGYQAYDRLPNVRIGCWAHLRRKFEESLNAMPASQKKEDTQAFKLKAMIDKMFNLEKKCKGKTAEERKAFRQGKTAAIMNEFFDKVHNIYDILEYGHTTATFKKAIVYAINQEESLRKVIEYGEADLSSNSVERIIRNFTIGRDNWLFVNTTSGGKASGAFYSIIVTAKENGLKTYDYLEYLFEHLPETDLDDEEEIEKLMPWYDGLPDNLRLKKKA